MCPKAARWIRRLAVKLVTTVDRRKACTHLWEMVCLSTHQLRRANVLRPNDVQQPAIVHFYAGRCQPRLRDSRAKRLTTALMLTMFSRLSSVTAAVTATPFPGNLLMVHRPLHKYRVGQKPPLFKVYYFCVWWYRKSCITSKCSAFNRE